MYGHQEGHLFVMSLTKKVKCQMALVLKSKTLLKLHTQGSQTAKVRPAGLSF